MSQYPVQGGSEPSGPAPVSVAPTPNELFVCLLIGALGRADYLGHFAPIASF